MRRGVALTATALALIAIVAVPRLPVARGATPPNVVLIVTDDQRWDELENMPNVQSLLDQHGVRFTNTFEPNSLCCPSRSTILSGQFSNHTGVWNNAAPNGGFLAFVPHESKTIATWLHAAGYRTGLVGKYLNQFTVKTAKSTSNPTGLLARPGWDYWTSFINGLTSGGEPPAYYDYQLDLGATQSKPGTLTTFGDPGAPTAACTTFGTCYSTTVLGSQATTFINATPTSQPFFLYFTPFGPHTPFTPAPQDADALPTCTSGESPPGCYQPMTLRGPGQCPPQDGSPPFCSENLDRTGTNEVSWVKALPSTGTGFNTGDRRLQEQTLLEVDRQVGNILSAVSARGQLANTVFIFTSDNSLSGDSHRWTAKETAWDEAGHDPFIIRFDPLTAGLAGTVDPSFILNADIAPTLLALAGVAEPAGYSFDGQVLPTFDPSFARTEFPLEHLAHGGDPPTYCGVRTTPGYSEAGVTGAWKYVRYQNLPGTGYPAYEEELYHLTVDPFEETNLAGNPAYASTLATLQADARALCAPPPPGYAWPSGQTISRVKQVGKATTTATSSPLQLSVTVGSGGIPAGDTVVLGVAAQGNRAISASDTTGTNVYSVAASRPYAGTGACTSAILTSTLTTPLAAGQTITVALGSKATAWGFAADEWTGMTGTVDATGKADSGGKKTKTPTVTTSATTTHAKEAVIGTACTTGNPTISAGPGYAASAMLKMVGSANKRDLGDEFKTVSTAGTQTAKFTSSTAQYWSAVIATLS